MIEAKNEFLAKKTLDAQESSVIKLDSSDQVKVVLIEPVDEITLEQPEVKQEESVLNYVGEFIYDTKLYEDEIHKTIWKTLKTKFEDGVEEHM